jgi:hydrogenase maturation protease
MKTLVLGMGIPILSDDGVGLSVASELQKTLNNPEVTVKQTELGGINLLELLTGYDRAIIVDAIRTGFARPGEIHRLTPESLWRSRHLDSTHSISLPQVLQLGKKLGMALPQEIIIFAIEAENVETFGETFSPRVQKAVARCVEKICKAI